MESTYFYDVPKIPMFFLVEELNLTRVRCLQYKDGKLYGVLPELDVHNISDDFYTEEHWNSKYESPFYCMYYEDSKLMIGSTPVSYYLESAENELGYSQESFFRSLMGDAKNLGCPIFASIEDARAYAYGTGNPKPLEYPTSL